MKFCDKAVNNIECGFKIYMSGDIFVSAGNCWANTQGFSYSVKIWGTNNNGKAYKITSNDIQNVY